MQPIQSFRSSTAMKRTLGRSTAWPRSESVSKIVEMRLGIMMLKHLKRCPAKDQVPNLCELKSFGVRLIPGRKKLPGGGDPRGEFGERWKLTNSA